MNAIIRVQPTRHKRVEFARWAVAQQPKVGTVSPQAFGVPPHLFTDMPEDLLRGSLVDGRPYISPADEEPTEPAPVGAPDLLGVATFEAGELAAVLGQDRPQTHVPLRDTAGDTSRDTPAGNGTTGADIPPVISEDTATDTADTRKDTAGDSDSSDPATDNHQCPHCPRSFTSSRGLEVHARRHRED
ncbi:C2H2-type zinc finger protein [Streptomyces sp. NPDC102437]|uniref:C2H2-type zinc finger protein n=1 Tax=Streptomyces sp. NPDC102437 TaxID=3366175 RepID=UPI0038081515